MNYAKALAAVAATVLSGVVVAMASGAAITPAQWINIAIAGVGACAVFAAPNVPGAMYTKSIIAVLTAVLTFISTVVAGCLNFAECHISTASWLQVAVIALGALGIYAVPNKTTEARSANP
ncbi:MAG TPA: hypothetical protein VIX17_11550 [Pyrinomonadaceae bacterium]|jgi:hypothetical protein